MSKTKRGNAELLVIDGDNGVSKSVRATVLHTPAGLLLTVHSVASSQPQTTTELTWFNPDGSRRIVRSPP